MLCGLSWGLAYCACPKTNPPPQESGERRQRQQPVARDRRKRRDRRQQQQPTEFERRDPSFTAGPWWESKPRQFLMACVIVGRNTGFMPEWLRKRIVTTYLQRWWHDS